MSQDQLRSGLRMLKRSWSSSEHETNDPSTESKPVCIDLCNSPPRRTPLQELNEDTSHKQRKCTHDEHMSQTEKERTEDDDFLPFEPLKSNNTCVGATAKRAATTSSSHTSSNLNALIKPLIRSREKPFPAPAHVASVQRPPEKRSAARVFLSREQQSVLEAVVKQEKSVFFTGSAGAGKSYLLRQIIQDLHVKYSKSPGAVAITASTGIAACNIGGITLHSFSGVGVGTGTPDQLVRTVRRNRPTVTRWKKTAVLVIDEVSMIDPKLFEKLDHVARVIRQSNRPFGGIQVVMSGDFFQLPPVSPNGQTSFVFESPVWSSMIQQKFNLTEVFRQRDQTFVNMLNDMRYGKLAPETIRIFSQLERTPSLPEGITPTELYALRRDVEKANQMRLDALQTDMRTYTSMDSGQLPPDQLQRTLDNFMAPRHMALKKGAQVMLIKNVDRELSNGSVGTVLDFLDEDSFKDQYGEEDVSDELLARAERAPGVSRTMQQERTEARAAPRWPLIRFHLVNGHVRDYLARPESWKMEDPNGKVVASRTQVPVILAWAMSIHKSYVSWGLSALHLCT